MSDYLLPQPSRMERVMQDQSYRIVQRIVDSTVALIYTRFGGVYRDGELLPEGLVRMECEEAALGRVFLPESERTPDKIDLLFVHEIFQVLFKHLSDRLDVYDKIAMERLNYAPIQPIVIQKARGRRKGEINGS